MEDSQSNRNIFSVRVVSIDFYMAPPIPGLDICYSSFQGGKVNEVPVIRVYGSTPAGQKTCLHIHRAFPYIYVPCADISLQLDQEGDAYTHSLSISLEKAMTLKGNAGSKRQHIHGCSLVRARKFYGYHSSEELFVKIYLYYPHDVSRAANLLLNGAVLDRILQPHESHIPFILQFLVDCNLHGMGHLHLSKIKFRYPVPDTFSRRRYNLSMQELADPGGDAVLDSPMWISATIPSDWLWQPPGELSTSSDAEFHCPERQSVCELEGDATIDEILNQQFKMYSSLSQTCSDVKMVQSLIPIWEEYEKTGVHEATIPPDFGKPLPEDVLKVLSVGCNFDFKLIDLCTKAEKLLFMIPDEGISVGIENVNFTNSDGEPRTCSAETDIIGRLSPPDLLCQGGVKFIEGKDETPKLLTVNEMASSAMIETLNVQATEKEALDLLKWLAASQAMEDINSDDELVHETILSPILPATTIDKVLEKAYVDYEIESQKDCQDILESVDDLIHNDLLMETCSFSINANPLTQEPPTNRIPRIDGSADDGFSNSCAISSELQSEVEMKSELRGSSQFHLLQDTGKSACKRDKKNQLWSSLHLTHKDSNALESVALCRTCPSERETRGSSGTNYLVRNTLRSYISSSGDNVGRSLSDATEVSTLVNCSVRDLMRRKRWHCSEQPDCQFHISKKIVHEKDINDNTIILPKRLDFQTPKTHDEQTKFLAVHEIAANCNDGPLPGKPSSLSGSDHSLQASWLKGENFGQPELIPDPFQLCTRSQPINSYEVTSTICSGAYDAEISNITPTDTNAADCDGFNYKLESCLDVQLSKKDAMCKILDAERRWQTDAAINMVTSHIESNGMTICKKPPYADWTSRENDTAPCLPPASEFHLLVDEQNCDITSGKGLDGLLPFFESDFQKERQKLNRYSVDGDSNAHQEIFLGVPTLCQNDGSYLYLLTPKISPPLVHSVSAWLFCKDKGLSSNAIGSMPINFNKDLPECGLMSHPRPLQDIGHQEINSKENVLPGSGSTSHMRPSLDQMHQDINLERKGSCSDMTLVKQTVEKIEEGKADMDNLEDISQISGPDGKSRATPLGQIGFQDPASVGCGQQLTLLSIEVLAESRGDLIPDPQLDAINIVALGFQDDSNSEVEVLVLLRSDAESSQRSIDGLCGCKMMVFHDEKYLLIHFVKIVSSSDPDILMGWDIQGCSLGFLAERASHIGLGLLNSISRTPETRTGSGDTKTTDEKRILDATCTNLVTTDCAVENSIIEDEWGRTHASGIHVGGRVVLNVWRLIRGEVKLNLYSAEAVAEAVLRRKIPFIHCKVLTKWFSSGHGQARFRCIEYIIERAKLNLEIMNQLDMVNRTSELARVFGIDFFSVLSRGSQYRVESMFLRLAHAQNYLAISPGNQQVASQPAMECLPLVMEPESGFYADPVVVLDFQSLYPSMIIAYNLCFCTCLGKVASSKANTLGVSSFSPELHVLRDLKDQITVTPNGVMFVPPKVCKGVLPRLLEEILATRIMVKKAMKKLASSQQVLHRIFNARQLALKLISNVTYGYTAAGFSGRMPCAELADSIVQCGRSTLERAIYFVNTHEKWNAKVIYGDTDSMFVLLKGRTMKESFRIGQEIASAVTAMNPDPVMLKMEKVYHPCFLLTKKRYVGYSYESPEQVVPNFDAKGIETVRRDTCGAVAKIMEQSLRLFFEHQEIPEIKTYLHRQWKRILSGRVSLQDFIFAKEVRLGTYSSRASSLPPAAIVAIKAMRVNPRAEPRYGERVPYVVVHGEPGSRLVDLVVDPLELLAIDSRFRINDLYYIKKQIIPALQRVFGLVGADLNQWFSEMPRPGREVSAKRPLFSANPHRTRIDYYFLSKHCILCGGLAQSSVHLCDQCSQHTMAAATALTGRTSKLEREMQHLVAICRHCGGGDWILESGIKCTSISCPVFYERRKVQKELQSLNVVAADKGFYPRCMVEWF